MTTATPKFITLTEFLVFPNIDESPAWEHINGEAIQKPMGGGKHSILQKKIVGVIDRLDSNYEAFPELRCTVGDRSIVPDVSVVERDRVPIDESGEITSIGIEFAPDWVIEILSPNQSQTKVTGNILHCMKNGCRLGWLIDPKEKSVLVYQRDRLPELLRGAEQLLVLEDIDLVLTVEQIFSWLRR
ncbi:MAG: Uma2 family endonuclease [Timaviella obliquedivisa GSE-PSE-MK23-08B]|jgi:Uma2 family endonuclease|nr:Uma2 family endonuclease [Timaviella obliquedivisa GSE-PSE-MK23-08B]